jgi:hypothetical protein
MGLAQVSCVAFWLSLYFVFNLSLTLYNKFILLSFPFPYTLTATHALFASLGLHVLLRHALFPHRALAPSERWKILFFSALYTLNISVSNLSLQMVTIPVGTPNFSRLLPRFKNT